MDQTSLAGIVLAAGKGTRMKSELPKGLHKICDVPMVELIGRALKGAGVEKPIMVIGHGGDLMIETLGDSYSYVWQREQKGTGHAVRMAEEMLDGLDGAVLVTPGDTPLLSTEALKALADAHFATNAACTMATIRVPNPYGYGRVVRDRDGNVLEIVEHRDASEEVRKIHEINSAIYCFRVATLLEILPRIQNDNDQHEFYLTDSIKEINKIGGVVKALLFEDHDLLIGVNDRWQLAEAAKALRLRILKKHALEGVTLIDPDTTHIGADVQIGLDTVVGAFTIILGETSIGLNCEIGPNSRIVNSTIGNGCSVLMSNLNEATLLDGSRCGPYANLRPRSVLGEGARVGNFVEVKNASLGSSVSVSHLSYIGDGSIGANTNIGAGTIFCNYDGFHKNRTDIGEGVFVGSNSTLVAPVSIGDGALIAAGSVITHDIPADALGIARQRQEVKEAWAAHRRKRLRQTD